ncbi:S-layer homology domain-containing protein [Sporomusa acidovorans]|uniref:SLH domain-containing protein n=1 Tax=Sporomusa acidovorans (strain ATCC 49682 / DSM 3132 / Mol) TaxID=1123286 RepID=A0ABZ3IXH9_SPOA4|nr:S-layer homology domain-containing protein [Sporomusa acidovorans]OZC23360.1 outer membrane protein alpha precursor [Sporomusa acidovorans DSM 3132]SDE42997.1 cyanobacterial porin [Sporomusa acidovorans]
MNKKIAMALTLSIALGIAGTTFAARPFADVPANHWAYDAVASLAKAGIVDGYGDGTFRGDHIMTRYEMAMIVGKAMEKAEKADGQQKELIKKLSTEFSGELQNLGVKVDSVKTKVDKLPQFSGEIKDRYRNGDITNPAGVKQGTWIQHKQILAFDVNGKINDDWKYVFELRNDNKTNQGAYAGYLGNDESTSNYGSYIRVANVQGPIGCFNVTLGRQDYTLATGFINGASTLQGAKISYGNTVKVNLVYGRDFRSGKIFSSDKKQSFLATSDEFWDSTSEGSTIVTGGDVSIPVGPGTLKATYFQTKNNDIHVSTKRWEAGYVVPFAHDYIFTGAYAKSDASDYNKGYMLQVSYKGADLNKPGSYGAWAHYLKADPSVIWDSFSGVADWTYAASGSKGYEIGFAYVPAKNIKWDFYYDDIKATVPGDKSKTKFYQTQLHFFF